jgi:ATP-binding cassette subfamily B protein
MGGPTGSLHPLSLSFIIAYSFLEGGRPLPLHAEIASTETNFNVKDTVSFNRDTKKAKDRVRGLLRLMRGYRGYYAVALTCQILEALTNTLSLAMVGLMIDNLLRTPGPDLPQALIGVGLIFVLLAALRGFFSFNSARLTAATSQGIALRLRDYLFDHLQHLNFTFQDKAKTGDLIQRVTSDIGTVERFFSEQIIGIGRIFVLAIVNFLALMVIHVQLALLSVAVVPFIAALSLFFFHRIAKAWDVFQEQEGKLSNTLQENLSAVRVVKAFARQPYEIAKFEKENAERFRLGIGFTKLHSLYWPFTDFLTGMQMMISFLAGGFLVLNGQVTIGETVLFRGQMTVGQYVTYIALLGWIIQPMRNLGRLIVQFTTGLVSYDRIAEILIEDWEPLGREETPPVKELKGQVSFKNVGFEYEAGKPVLSNITFDVQPGQTIALLGSTGSGKTSLMGLLPRFYEYTSGQITIDGFELKELSRTFLRQQIGIVEQEPFLFSRTIRENITYGVARDVSDEEVIAAARAAAVHEVIMTFPDNYKTVVGERGVTLSGGQKQRVVLARTLLKNPNILIMDDATSSVDTETESQIRAALSKMSKDRTTFIIAHRIQTVMIADLILVMDKGRIVQRGTHETLMQEKGGIYHRTYEMQAQIETELEKELSGV